MILEQFELRFLPQDGPPNGYTFEVRHVTSHTNVVASGVATTLPLAKSRAYRACAEYFEDMARVHLARAKQERGEL